MALKDKKVNRVVDKGSLPRGLQQPWRFFNSVDERGIVEGGQK